MDDLSTRHFYFLLLVTGLALGIPLLIVWLGIPILFFVVVISWAFASFERAMIISWLKEEVTAIGQPSSEDVDLWTRINAHFTNPATEKRMLHLFSKFPIGIVSFVIVITLVALTQGLLTMPITYPYFKDM